MCKIRPTENENLLTPKRGASAYKQVWEQVPSSRRIIEDTNKFLNAIKVISDHEGRAVAGLGTRNGHKNAETKLLHQKRGGRRVKKEGRYNRWVHSDADGCIEGCIASSVAIANMLKNEDDKSVRIIKK